LNVSKFQTLVNIKFTSVFKKTPTPRFKQHHRIASLQTLGEKNRKKVFFFLDILWAETGNKKSKIGKNMERKRQPKSFPKSLGKVFSFRDNIMGTCHPKRTLTKVRVRFTLLSIF